MNRAFRIGARLIAGLGIMAGIGWLGLRVRPSPFPAYPDRMPPMETMPLPRGLPDPVARYFLEAAGGQLPVISSAVLTGQADLRLGGVTMPSRLRFTHLAGQGYHHYIETTWFGFPMMRVNEWYLDGAARMELPFGVVSGQPKVDLAANLALWGESIWLPSVLATDPRVRWESIDGDSARLVVPSGQGQDTDSFTVVFDRQTGLIQSMEALRYRSATDERKIPWRMEPLGWQTFHGMRLPSPAAVTWADQGRPWLVLSLEGVTYNVDVSNYIRASGP